VPLAEGQSRLLESSGRVQQPSETALWSSHNCRWIRHFEEKLARRVRPAVLRMKYLFLSIPGDCAFGRVCGYSAIAIFSF
jgi:hypothetical protein